MKNILEEVAGDDRAGEVSNDRQLLEDILLNLLTENASF